MSEFLDQVKQQCARTPKAPAFKNSSGEVLTYGALDAQSNLLAAWLVENAANLGAAAAGAQAFAANNSEGSPSTAATPNAAAPSSTSAYPAHQPVPVVLLGHKQTGMLTSMVACMKAGHAYVPLDASLPHARVEGIIGQLGRCVVLEVQRGLLEGLALDPNLVLAVTFDQLNSVISPAGTGAANTPEIDPVRAISGTDAQYILFTSGSTGAPKGVVQTALTIDCTSKYFARFIPEGAAGNPNTPPSAGRAVTFFNRTHYSFDVSLFDISIALPHGHCLFALDSTEEESLARTFEALASENPSLWVSTPSFLDMCLVDPSFSQELMPNLASIIVCGETLHNKTAAKCLERFPRARLYNTYGPTETQAITDVEITPEMAAAPTPLPIGTPSPFNQLQVIDTQTGAPQPPNTPGEVVIYGQTVANGYFGRPDLTQKAFATAQDAQGQQIRSYKTGDEGFLDAQGMLHYIGRLDLQVKINGFRIELEEIEKTLEEIPWVLRACVVTQSRAGGATSLAAHVVISAQHEESRQTTREIKELLKATLPAYMMPRTVTYHDSFPQNLNGKVDRKALQNWKAAK